ITFEFTRSRKLAKAAVASRVQRRVRPSSFASGCDLAGQLPGSYPNSRSSCEQRQALAIFAAHWTAASRAGRCQAQEPPSDSCHGTSRSSTSRYRNRSALSAWFWVDAATRPSTGEPAEESRHLRRAYFRGMALAVKEDVPADPRDVRLFRPPAVVPAAQRIMPDRHPPFAGG